MGRASTLAGRSLRGFCAALGVVAVLAAAPVGAQPCTPPPTGMVGWWPGDGNANDISGANDGTLQNGAAFVAGKVAGAFSLDGIDDYVSLPGTYQYADGDDFTVDLWVSLDPDSTNTHVFVYDQRAGTLQGTGVSIVGGIVEFGGRCDNLLPGTIWGGVSTTTIPSDGQFHHIAVVVDWAADETRLYINGGLEDVGDLSGCDGLTGSDKFYLGTIGNLDSSFQLKGRIDEVEVFDRALSAGEIQTIVDAGSAGKCKAAAVPAVGPRAVAVLLLLLLGVVTVLVAYRRRTALTAR